MQSALTLTTETQFAMLHAIARQVYHHMHGKTLAAANPPATDQPASLSHSSEANDIELLIRKCGSQLTRLHTIKAKELERLSRTASSSVKSS